MLSVFLMFVSSYFYLNSLSPVLDLVIFTVCGLRIFWLGIGRNASFCSLDLVKFLVLYYIFSYNVFLYLFNPNVFLILHISTV